MNNIDLQIASENPHIPSLEYFEKWMTAVCDKPAKICLRIVNKTEMTKLNEIYRHRSGVTNILSFHYHNDSQNSFLGDLVICADQVEQEALTQQKNLLAHWAHIFIHGLLHLLGYTHDSEIEAQKMEQREIEILQKLGYSNPYKI